MVMLLSTYQTQFIPSDFIGPYAPGAVVIGADIHSFNMMGPVFLFICNGQETLNHFIFQAQQHLYFKKWLLSLRFLFSFLSNILCIIFIPQPLYSAPSVPFCFFCVSTIFLSLPSSLPFFFFFLPVQGTNPGLLQSIKRFSWIYKAFG